MVPRLRDQRGSAQDFGEDGPAVPRASRFESVAAIGVEMNPGLKEFVDLVKLKPPPQEYPWEDY